MPNTCLGTNEQEKSRHEAKNSPAGGFLWGLTDHACRCCFGRILVRETFDRRKVYRCSNCGLEREGRTESAICCCGIKLKTGSDAGIRCQHNPEKSPEFPSEIVAAEVEMSAS